MEDRMAPDRQPEEAEEAEETAEIETEQEVEEVDPEEIAEEADPEEEAEAEAETETEEVEAEPPAKPASRAQRRIQALSEEVRELRKKVEAPPQRQPDPAAEAERARREREEDEQVKLSGDPDLIARHAVGKVEKRLSAQFNSVVHHVVDRADKTDFAALCAENPAVKAVAPDVEKQLVISRSQGLNPTREALAKFLIGERVLSRAKGAKTRQEKVAAQGRQRQQAKPGSARSDVNSSGRRKQDSQEERARRLDESGQL
jgi:hypothetical protein